MRKHLHVLKMQTNNSWRKILLKDKMIMNSKDYRWNYLCQELNTFLSFRNSFIRVIPHRLWKWLIMSFWVWGKASSLELTFEVERSHDHLTQVEPVFTFSPYLVGRNGRRGEEWKWKKGGENKWKRKSISFSLFGWIRNSFFLPLFFSLSPPFLSSPILIILQTKHARRTYVRFHQTNF